jgi:hypothetical protein
MFAAYSDVIEEEARFSRSANFNSIGIESPNFANRWTANNNECSFSGGQIGEFWRCIELF